MNFNEIDLGVVLKDDNEDEKLKNLLESEDLCGLFQYLNDVIKRPQFMLILLQMLESLINIKYKRFVKDLWDELDVRSEYKCYPLNDQTRMLALMVYLKHFHTKLFTYEQFDRVYSFNSFVDKKFVGEQLIVLLKKEHKDYQKYCQFILTFIARLQLDQQIMFKALMIIFLKVNFRKKSFY